jgi:drug/metabolite transporter superfamily protein YnfA
MSEGDINQSKKERRRQIGSIGTVARVVIGFFMLLNGLTGGRVEAIHGDIQTGFELSSVAIGVVAFPVVLLVWQWLRARTSPTRYEATGPLATTVNIVVFIALVLTPLYARPLSFTSNAALVFYGSSMLLAAARGYGGCEVLAISNWILRRDDQIGCLVLSPIDDYERRLKSAHLNRQ